MFYIKDGLSFSLLSAYGWFQLSSIYSLPLSTLQRQQGRRSFSTTDVTDQSPQRRHKPCSEALTLSAVVVINCHREVPWRFPVVLNTMCCQICLANIYIYTNTLHREIKFQKELMLCVSEVGGKMQIKTQSAH